MKNLLLAALAFLALAGIAEAQVACTVHAQKEMQAAQALSVSDCERDVKVEAAGVTVTHRVNGVLQTDVFLSWNTTIRVVYNEPANGWQVLVYLKTSQGCAPGVCTFPVQYMVKDRRDVKYLSGGLLVSLIEMWNAPSVFYAWEAIERVDVKPID